MNFVGKFGFVDFWYFYVGVWVVVCFDMGVVYFVCFIGVLIVVLFGFGSVLVYGVGCYWCDVLFVVVMIVDMLCCD